jgi:DNA-binding transcriptional LysR family regulator
MLFSRIRTLLLAAVIFSACQPDIQTAPPVPTVSFWQVQYTPATAWLMPAFHTCALEQPGVNLLVSETLAQTGDVQTADFSFAWGERSSPPSFAAVIAQDTLAVVVNPSNPITSLTVSEIQGLFSGKDDRWSPLIQVKCASCGTDFEGPVRAYVYAHGGEMQLAATWIQSGPEAILAPNPAAVAAAIAGEPHSIGFVPARWLDSSLKQVEIVGAQQGLLSRPLLAMAPTEPGGAKRAWLLCLQEQIK